MSEQKEKWIEAVGKLLKLTQEDRIVWISLHPEAVRSKNPDDVIEDVFSTEYKGKVLRIYSRRFRTLVTNPFDGIFGAKTAKPEIVVRKEVLLEILDPQGNPVWTFPKENILVDLLTSIKFQVSGVKKFLNDILDE